MRHQAKLIWAAARLLRHVPRWLRLPQGSAAACDMARRELARFIGRCGASLEQRGVTVTGGTLFVANHISWADIAVLGALLDGGFVSRGDLADWALVGRLARHRGTVFVSRDRRMDSGRQADAIRAVLAAGGDVILFAEGTTSGGADVRPYRQALFAAADAARQVQPLVIAYLRPDGMPLSPEDRRRVAWIDDDGLGHVLTTFARPVTAVVEFLDPLDPEAFASRKALAAAAHAAGQAAYAAYVS